MGEEIVIEKIECYKDSYQIDIRYLESKKGDRLFIKKHKLFDIIAKAEAAIMGRSE